MNRFVRVGAFLCLFLSLTALGQTVAVSGHIKDASGATVSGGSASNGYKACFSLKDGNGQTVPNPRITGGGGSLIVSQGFCVTPDGTGAFSTPLVANDQVLNADGTSGGTQWFVYYQKGNNFITGANYTFALADTTENLDTKIANAVSPIVPSPTGDSTYARLDGGNTPFTGAIGTKNIAATGTISATGAITGGAVSGAISLGAVTTGSVNNTVTVNSLTAGADMCAKIATGIAALIAASPTGGIVDATAFQGTQACASNPFAGLVYGVPGAPLKLSLGVVTVQINTASAVWFINSQNVDIEGISPWHTWITYTGSGAVSYVIGFDASSNSINGGFGVYGNHLKGVFVDGNTHVTNAVAFINNERPILTDVSAWGATNAGVYIQSAVTPTLYNVHVSNKDRVQTGLPNTQVPAFGVLLDSGTFGAGFAQTTDGTIVDPILEGVGLGLYLKAASSIKVLGGTSETNTSTTAGLQVDAGSANNTINGLDMESNTGTNDVLDNGTSTKLENIIAISGGVSIGAGSINSKIEGGNIASITVNASAQSPGGNWRLPINWSATRVWQGSANSASLGWNASGGGGEANYYNNVFTSAGAEAHTWYSANSGNTAYNKQAFLDASGNFQLLRGKITGYGGLPTAGQGVTWVPASTLQKAETTTADANVLTLTPQATSGQYRVSVSISVSAATAGIISWSLSWTDSNGTAQSNIVQNLTQIQPSGTAAPAQSFTTSAAANYFGSSTIDINSAAANIVVKWVGGGVTTAKMSATIERLQ